MSSHTLPNKPFTFLRHGQTEWNAKGLCQGQLDIPLSDVGRQEARLAATLLSFKPSIICHSPLVRAKETAAIIQEELGCPRLVEIEALQERSWGELEGCESMLMYELEDREHKEPSVIAERGGEAPHLFKSRLIEAMHACAEYDEALIVSHGRVFAALCELMGLKKTMQLPNAIPVVCTPVDKGWSYQVMEKVSIGGSTRCS